MDIITRNFLENPMWIYIALALAEAVLLYLWKNRQKKKILLMMIAPPILAGLIWLISSLVVTDREEIMLRFTQIALQVKDGKITAAQKYLDEKFVGTLQGTEITKSGALKLLSLRGKVIAVKRIKITQEQIDVSGRSAKMSVVTTVFYGNENARMPILWRFEWIERSDEGWKMLTSKEPDLGWLGGIK